MSPEENGITAPAAETDRGARARRVPGADPRPPAGEARRSCASAGSSPTRSASTATRPRRRCTRSSPTSPPAPTPARSSASPAGSWPSAATAASTSPTSATRPARSSCWSTRDAVGADELHDFSDLDLGDWVGVEGTVIASDNGRALGPGRQLRAALQEPAGAARRPPRRHRPRDPLPPALPRPDPRRAARGGSSRSAPR